jgi:LmbE family N-acetylglucosaminyl deacetylase
MWVAGLEPNRFVDITEQFDRKLAALQAHVSQVGGRDDLADALRSWGAANAAQGGLEAGRLAEMYRELDTR